MKHGAVSLVALAMLAVSTSAGAAPTPLSSLSPLPKQGATVIQEKISGITVRVEKASRSEWHSIHASQGYCFAYTGFGMQVANRWESTITDDDRVALVRLVEKDGKATLEAARLAFDSTSGTMGVSAKSTVALTEVAKTEGVTVWAFREGKSITLLTSSTMSGIETPPRETDADMMISGVSNDACSFTLARLDTTAQAPVVHLVHETARKKGEPTTRTIVDASISRVTRDPEPLVAVRIHTKTI